MLAGRIKVREDVRRRKKCCGNKGEGGGKGGRKGTPKGQREATPYLNTKYS